MKIQREKQMKRQKAIQKFELEPEPKSEPKPNNNDRKKIKDIWSKGNEILKMLNQKNNNSKEKLQDKIIEISLICNNSSNIKTINDHIGSFIKYSKHNITVIDYKDFDSIYNIKSELVVLHYSIMHVIAMDLSRFIDIISIKQHIQNAD